MNTFIRWGKFNLVGAMGMGVQLAALALFNRWRPGHYLVASAAALELTLLHNFVWHLRITWRDRRQDRALPGQLLRFHLSNGLVSMLGNLALMRLLVEEAGLPVLTANCIAILCCSVVNFCLGDSWTFAAGRPAQSEMDPAGPATMHRAPSLRLFSVARVGNQCPPPARSEGAKSGAGPGSPATGLCSGGGDAAPTAGQETGATDCRSGREIGTANIVPFQCLVPRACARSTPPVPGKRQTSPAHRSRLSPARTLLW